MAIIIHPAKQRGLSKAPWLLSHHSFSFNDWYEPTRMGFGALRVLNEDFIAPNKGFPSHSHQNMEIVTIVLSGALEHKDSTGSHGIIKAGDVQHMSAGTGVTHSEFNASKTEPCHLLQIWIEPNQKNIKPAYAQQKILLLKNRLVPIVSGTKLDNTLSMQADATLFLAQIDGTLVLEKELQAYLFLIEGTAKVNSHELVQGDGAGITEPVTIYANGKLLIVITEHSNL